MARLTDDEIKAHKAWLATWRAPSEMSRYVDQVNDQMGSTDFFNQAGVEFLRDAWAAATFSSKRNAEYVRLVADQWPDFQMRRMEKLQQFECVEADLLGRRRGQEYRDAENRAGSNGIFFEHDPVEDWLARAEQVPAALKAAVEKKIGKFYSEKVELLIYLNIEEFGARQHEIELSFPKVVAQAKAHFEATWILWKDRIYGPW